MKKNGVFFFGEWSPIVENREGEHASESPGLIRLRTALSSQERIPTSVSYLDGQQRLSNLQVPWGTKAPRATVLPPIFSGYEGYPQGYGNKSNSVSEPLGYLVPWIIFCCCSRISSKPKPLVSSGSSKSHGLGPPRLAPPVIRLDLRTRLQALHNSKNIALLQITPTSAEGASVACFENSIRLQFIACLVYVGNCVQCWKRYADK